MSTIFFISDQHFGHDRDFILNRFDSITFSCIEDHDEFLVEQWNSVVNKRDSIYVLGDVAVNKKYLKYFDRMKGQKQLLMGNHDSYVTEEYLKYFRRIRPAFKHKGFWLSHIPIHSDSLRDKMNIHGHVHKRNVKDPRYINVCVEALNGVPLSLDGAKILEKKYEESYGVCE